jgi:hypothetical protein
MVSLIAGYLIADKFYFEGFTAHILGDGLWICWGIRTGAYGLMVTQIAFFILSVYGLYRL